MSTQQPADMSYPRPPMQDRQPSNGPVVLASNNPFRRGPSPNTTLAQPSQPFVDNGPRPIPSTNPFLSAEQRPPPMSMAPTNMPMPMPRQRQPSPSSYMPSYTARSDSLPRQMPHRPSPEMSIQNGPGPVPQNPSTSMPLPYGVPPPRAQPPHSYQRHRPTRSQDHGRRFNIEQALAEEPANIFATPPKNNDSRSRRNSESSVTEAVKLESQRAREHRRRVPRETRSRETKSKETRGPKPKKPNAHMDTIDKLDVTSMWGAGFFHHDGPFDAANPRRNQKANREAPMAAFAEGSANNALGGAGPVNKAIDMDKIHGLGAESFADYNAAPVQPAPPPLARIPSTQQTLSQSPPQASIHGAASRIDRSLLSDATEVIDPKISSHQVHGEESLGLGTSTFLEGAPAAPAAVRGTMQRRTTDDNIGGGVQRKKSLMQKFSRGPSNPSREQTAAEERYEALERSQTNPGNTPSPPLKPRMPLSGGGPSKMNETTPFFAGANNGKKDPSVNVQGLDESGEPLARIRTLSSPQRPMVKGTLRTYESGQGAPASGGISPELETKTVTSGLLSRVKSLRGGRKPRAES